MRRIKVYVVVPPRLLLLDVAGPPRGFATGEPGRVAFLKSCRQRDVPDTSKPYLARQKSGISGKTPSGRDFRVN